MRCVVCLIRDGKQVGARYLFGGDSLCKPHLSERWVRVLDGVGQEDLPEEMTREESDDETN